MLRNVVAHAHGAERQVAARQSLRHADEVGYNLPMIHRKPLTGPSKPGHHLVGDHQYAVFVANLADTLQIAVGRHKNAVRSRYGFQYECRNRPWTFQLDDFLDIRQRLLHRVPPTLDAMIGIEDTDDSGDAGLGCPAPGVASKRSASGSRAVIRPVACEYLVPSRKKPGDLDGIFIGFGAAIRKKECVDVPGRDLGQLGSKTRPHLRGHKRVGVGKNGSLLVYGFNDTGIAVSNIDAHQLAVEVQEALALGRPEVDSLGAGDRNRIDVRLSRPLKECVFFAESDHFNAGHGGVYRICGCAHGIFLSTECPSELTSPP